MKMQSCSLIVCAVLLLAVVVAQDADEEECPTMCPALYSPTCGYNGEEYEIFSNECTMAVRACTTGQHIEKVDLENCPTEEEECST